jgi:phosphate-selective porin
MMRHIAALTAVVMALAASASAQPAPPAAATNCTDVQVGTAQSYDCINAQLGAVARGTQRFSSDANAPVTSSSPSNVVGTYNQGATRNRLGANFGKSVTPYRPANNPPPVLGSPR